MELRERVLFSRTSVWASEKAVPHRGGGSITATGAGRCIIGSAGLLSDGEVLALGADSGVAAVASGAAAVSGFFPSRMEALRSSGVRLPARDGESRDTESIDGRGPAAVIWFLDGGLSLGKREKAPPGGGPADIFAFISASSRNSIDVYTPSLVHDKR